MATITADKFACPICARSLEVRLTKKGKPYLTCDPCGVQVFIRGPAGIAEFARLIERGGRAGLMERLEEMELRYRLTCPKCGNKFWAEPELIETSVWDGNLKGFRCPQKGCGQIVPWEGK
jgi:predicted RNA-binding Zn-ribbon protein involved in translation (DUF1610 family)